MVIKDQLDRVEVVGVTRSSTRLAGHNLILLEVGVDGVVAVLEAAADISVAVVGAKAAAAAATPVPEVVKEDIPTHQV